MPVKIEPGVACEKCGCIFSDPENPDPIDCDMAIAHGCASCKSVVPEGYESIHQKKEASK